MAGFTLGELAEQIKGEVAGNAERLVEGIRSLEEAEDCHLSFLTNRRYLSSALASRAGALLVEDAALFAGRDLLVSREPYGALAQLLELFHPAEPEPPGIHVTAVVAPGVEVGEGVRVGPQAVIEAGAVLGAWATVGAGCYLGQGVIVGESSLLHPHVVVERDCRIGARCVLHSGVVVGSDGFGFATVGGIHRKVPQVGIVVVEDDVELGANVCIDRATLGETRVGRGTKVDNLVQIAHNVRVGEHSLLVAQSGIAGSTRLGHHVVMAGQSGAVGHITVGDRVRVSAQAALTEDTPADSWISGFPGRPHHVWLRAMANLFQLDGLRRRVKALEEALLRKEKHG
ncbi:MAG: UDP-3-O-(3-hydroxymyristoyl)glucosamine N-acyltransferase [Acidobacteriota bacterium]